MKTTKVRLRSLQQNKPTRVEPEDEHGFHFYYLSRQIAFRCCHHPGCSIHLAGACSAWREAFRQPGTPSWCHRHQKPSRQENHNTVSLLLGSQLKNEAKKKKNPITDQMQRWRKNSLLAALFVCLCLCRKVRLRSKHLQTKKKGNSSSLRSREGHYKSFYTLPQREKKKCLRQGALLVLSLLQLFPFCHGRTSRYPGWHRPTRWPYSSQKHCIHCRARRKFAGTDRQMWVTIFIGNERERKTHDALMPLSYRPQNDDERVRGVEAGPVQRMLRCFNNVAAADSHQPLFTNLVGQNMIEAWCNSTFLWAKGGRQ